MGVLPATGLGSVFQESVCTAAAVTEGGGLGGGRLQPSQHRTIHGFGDSGGDC